MKRILCFALCLVMMLSVCAMSASAAEYEVNEDSPLADIKVGFYGDSICYSGEQGTSLEYVQGWAGRIGYTNDMEWHNNGISAYSVSNCRGEKTIFSQLQNTIDEDYEMIILHGGTNDAWDNAAVGVMTDEDDFASYDSYNPATFAGGLERMFAYIREYAPDAMVGYIINFKFVNAERGQQVQDASGKTVYRLNYMEDYVEMTKKVCDKWRVPYVDLYHNDELTEKLHPKSGNTYLNTYLRDFIHPSSAGYDLIYPYIEEFMIDMVTEDEPAVTTAVTTTAITTAAPTAAPETTAAAEKIDEISGCGAFMGGSMLLVVATVGAGAVALRKRKER